MASGCEFTCDNKDCKCYKSGFIMLAPWPIGEIDKVIVSKRVKENKAFQEELRKMKEDGKQYSCINYPNVDEIPTLGYKVQKWCDKCLVIWNFEAMVGKPEETPEETVENAKIIDTCSKCNEKLRSFPQVVEEGIDCPHCNQKLIQQVWFSNETIEENIKNPKVGKKEEKND